ERRYRLPSVAPECQPEVIFAVEAHLLYPNDPRRVPDLRGDAREEAGAQRVDRLRAEQCQVARALGPFQIREMVDQLRQLRLRKRRCPEGQRVPAPIL